ncbi:CarD family transcriptional regulator [Pallidibacillus pasinlerensis]|uniref:Transcription factor YdeB n=1 Tax=Pallidibacillus pasinlerensis TaxID=2703818 RepID=A0ABX0A534_9BACI|nr:CarD family transcriptional regulator [Pallidibacillus pasinlerensis]NCU18556.1 transcription factor YdeB [Pallidibacillus pasinlerensis]
MFKIGERVFYPMNGVGIIEGIEEKEVLGKVQNYYLIHIPASNMNAMIPVDKAEQLGLRPITDKYTINQILSELPKKDIEIDMPWKDKYQLIMEKIKGGDIKDNCLVYKYLTEKSKEKPLNANEKTLLTKVHSFLIKEISMSKEISENEAEKLLVV